MKEEIEIDKGEGTWRRSEQYSKTHCTEQYSKTQIGLTPGQSFFLDLIFWNF